MTKIGQSIGCGSNALAQSSNEQTANAASVNCTRRRRSYASASAPPTNASSTSGTNSAAPSSPTASDECVIE